MPLTTSDLVKPPIHKFKWHAPLTPEESAMMKWRAEMLARDPASDWKAAINFYGLVIDEKNRPLPGASVDWITTNVSGNGQGSTVSGGNGRFFIGTTGKDMNVTVQKEGYRTVERTTEFEFAAFFQDDYYDHNQENPVIYHLRKIPAPEPIYIYTRGISNIPSGVKMSINPFTGYAVQGEMPEGMWIQFLPGPSNAPGREQYDIELGTAPGGGVIIVSGDSDEDAPEEGYQSTIDTNLIVDYVGHRYNNDLKAFFKDSAGHYGSVDVDVKLNGHDLTIDYVAKYNPGGGQSLAAPSGSQYQINPHLY